MSPAETFNPVPNPVMNSLVSPNKVILNESIPNPIIPIANSNVSMPSEIPVSTLPVPILGLKTIEDKDEAMDKLDGIEFSNDSENSFMDVRKEEEIIVDDERNGEIVLVVSYSGIITVMWSSTIGFLLKSWAALCGSF